MTLMFVCEWIVIADNISNALKVFENASWNHKENMSLDDVYIWHRLYLPGFYSPFPEHTISTHPKIDK